MSGSPDEIAEDLHKRDIERRINEHATTARLSLLTAKRSIRELYKLTMEDTHVVMVSVINVSIEVLERLLGIHGDG